MRITSSNTRQRISVASTKRVLRRIGSAALFLCVSGFAATAAADNTLTDISHITLPGNKQQLAFTLENPVVEPKSFTIDNPARIALDFFDTSNSLQKRMMEVNVGLLRSVTAIEAGGRTRVVVNLAALQPYTTKTDGNILYLTLDDVAAAPAVQLAEKAETAEDAATTTTVMAQTAQPVPAATAFQVAQKSEDGANKYLAEDSGNSSLVTADQVSSNRQSIRNIDFRRGPLGEGRVIFELSGTGIPADMREEGERLIIEFPDTDLPRNLQRRLDVMDFGTPIQFVDAVGGDQGTRVIITPTSQSFEQLAYQSDNMFTVELKPVTPEDVDAARKKRFGYTGEKLSLNFQDIELRSVLQLLADFTDLNVVVSDTVEGKLTLRLKNVPWDQALDIILQTKALDKRQSGNVIMVAPADEIARREQAELESLKQKTELAPLRTEFFQANYAKATELAELLKSGTGSILSDRGSVTVDDRTNTLLINDTAEQLAEIRALVHRLDIPIRQVLIESRIVIASDDFNKDIGVRWGINRNTTLNDGEGTIVSGNNTGVTNLVNGEAPGTGRFNVNLPATNAAGSIGLALAKLPFGTLLELELSAMQSEGRGEVVSSPRVITANQHEAYIEQGVEIPYLEAASSGATSVSFRKAVLGLTVTPQITPDDRIVMDLKVNKDTVGELVGAGDLQVPSIDTREVSTQVLVDNGETVVLGGVYEQTLIDKTDMVPFFGRLPIIGRMFQHTVTTDDKSELLVFVTPRIIRENNSLGY